MLEFIKQWLGAIIIIIIVAIIWFYVIKVFSSD
jgi:hypothetical protein